MGDLFHVRLGETFSKNLMLKASVMVAMGVLGACTSVDLEAQPQVQPLVSGLAEHVAEELADAHDSGIAHLKAGRLGLALRSFRLAMRRKPDSVETLNAIAVTYDQMGRFDLSRRYFEQALMLEPDSVQTLNNLGHSNLRQGRIDVALRYLQRAQKLAENDPMVQANVRFATAQAETFERRSFSHSNAGAKVAKHTPLTWIERTTLRTQTLITKPAELRIIPAAGPTIVPRRVNVRGRTDDTAVPPSTPNAVSAFIRPHKPAVPAAKRFKAVIEISNGAGRRRMAGRIGRYLAGRGQRVELITNADSFGYRKTVIFYRPEFRSEANRLAEMLPVNVTLQPCRRMSSDVRAVLGKDLIHFDRTFLHSSPQDV